MLGRWGLQRAGQVQGVERNEIHAAIGFHQAADLALDLHLELPSGVSVGEYQHRATLRCACGRQVHGLIDRGS